MWEVKRNGERREVVKRRQRGGKEEGGAG